MSKSKRFERLERLIFNEDSFITYKHLAYSEKLPINDAKSILSEFAKNNSAKLTTTYCLYSNNDDHVDLVLLETGQHLNELLKNGYKVGHVYGVRQADAVQPFQSAVLASELQALKLQLEESFQFNSFMTVGNSPQLKVVPVESRPVAVAAVSEKVKLVKQAKTAKPAGRKPPAKSAGLLDKFTSSTTTTKAPTEGNRPKCQPERKENVEQRAGKVKTESVDVPLKSLQDLSDLFDDETEVNEMFDLPAKKMDETPVPVVKEEKAKEEPAKKKRQMEKLSSPTSPPTSSPTPPKKQRLDQNEPAVLTKRQLVSETSLDENGFLVTEKVWRTVQVEQQPQQHLTTDDVNNKKKTATMTPATGGAVGKKKQATLFSFFK